MEPPVAVKDLVAEALRMQRVERSVPEMAASFVDDHLATDLGRA
jgi:hypothetical protein